MSCQKLSPPMPIVGTLNEYLNTTLYPFYFEQIACAHFTFHDKPIQVFSKLNYNLQHETFEHLTTKGSNDRLYNQKRCERMVWIRDILSGVCKDCETYRVFKDRTWKGKPNCSRYIIWCKEEDYVIILEERQRIVMLITAYCIIYQNKRNDLERKWATR